MERIYFCIYCYGSNGLTRLFITQLWVSPSQSESDAQEQSPLSTPIVKTAGQASVWTLRRITLPTVTLTPGWTHRDQVRTVRCPDLDQQALLTAVSPQVEIPRPVTRLGPVVR